MYLMASIPWLHSIPVGVGDIVEMNVVSLANKNRTPGCLGSVQHFQGSFYDACTDLKEKEAK